MFVDTRPPLWRTLMLFAVSGLLILAILFLLWGKLRTSEKNCCIVSDNTGKPIIHLGGFVTRPPSPVEREALPVLVASFALGLWMVVAVRKARERITIKRARTRALSIINGTWPPPSDEWYWLFPLACRSCGSRLSYTDYDEDVVWDPQHQSEFSAPPSIRHHCIRCGSASPEDMHALIPKESRWLTKSEHATIKSDPNYYRPWRGH